jgi:hypothetical protein
MTVPPSSGYCTPPGGHMELTDELGDRLRAAKDDQRQSGQLLSPLAPDLSDPGSQGQPPLGSDERLHRNSDDHRADP